MPYFWKEKILKEFPFIENVFYDGEKATGIDIKNARIDYDSFDLSPYLESKLFFVFISKYCPYQCTYCNAQKTGIMERNLNLIEEEIIYLKKRGFKKFRLAGNDLTLNKKRFLKICEIMKRLNVEWSGDGRVNHMTEKMYQSLKVSKGTLLFGIESANQEVLNGIKKGITLSQIIKNAQRLNELKIPFRYDFMFGFPKDSYQTAEEMINLRKITGELNYHCNLVCPYPETPLFEEMKRLKLVDESKLDYEDFSWINSPIASTVYLSKEEVQAVGKEIMLKGMFNKNVILNVLKMKKIKEYPLLVKRFFSFLIYGKRVWNK
jgi:radical SAM superfamily enzyme YgiQ (UPF0313 family)